MRSIPLLFLAFVASGCFAAAATPVGVQEAASLAGTAGTTATGYFATESSVALNSADIALIRAQAGLTREQALELRVKREHLEHERATTVGLLRDMAVARDDPTLANLAIWVEAGGDPDWAMKYALKAPSSPGGKL